VEGREFGDFFSFFEFFSGLIGDNLVGLCSCKLLVLRTFAVRNAELDGAAVGLCRGGREARYSEAVFVFEVSVGVGEDEAEVMMGFSVLVL
jgi:hypothetical protein